MEARAGLSAVAALALLWIVLWPSSVWAQACCAGSGAVTPGRLALHEDALVGLQLRAAHVIGAYDARARYASASAGTSEQDFGQDLVGAARMPFAPRLQLAALVPFVQTRRRAGGVSDFGGGIGDVNVSGRYDLYLAGQSRYVPGIAILAGVTLPTGTPAESSSPPLAADTTGVGAVQGNVGLALEQSFGPWLVTVYGILAKRAPRDVSGFRSELGTQLTVLAAVAYTFAGDYAVAAAASYAVEGTAELAGAEVASSSRRVPVVSAFGVAPLTDHLRLQGGLSLSPPLSELGKNQLATVALTATAVYAWY